MAGLIDSWRQAGRCALMACGLVLAGAALQGCAASGGGNALNRYADAGLITPSDEPESRRMARSRRELAAN